METRKSVESEMFVVMTRLRNLEINDSECLNFSGPSFFFSFSKKISGILYALDSISSQCYMIPMKKQEMGRVIDSPKAES